MKYKIRERGNPLQKDAPKKFYATPVWNGKVKTKKFAEEIAEACGVSKADAANILDAFYEILPKHLAAGDVVQLGDVGTLKASFTAEGCEKESDVNPATIKSIKVAYRPSTSLKEALKKVSFEKDETK